MVGWTGFVDSYGCFIRRLLWANLECWHWRNQIKSRSGYFRYPALVSGLVCCAQLFLTFVAALPQRPCSCCRCLPHLSSTPPSFPAICRIGHQRLFPNYTRDQHTLRNEADDEERANLLRTTFYIAIVARLVFVIHSIRQRQYKQQTQRD